MHVNEHTSTPVLKPEDFYSNNVKKVVTSTANQVGGWEEESIPFDKNQPSQQFTFSLNEVLEKVNQLAHSYLWFKKFHGCTIVSQQII